MYIPEVDLSRVGPAIYRYGEEEELEKNKERRSIINFNDSTKFYDANPNVRYDKNAELFLI